MTREDFRREMGNAFDSISGAPNPALSDRVRAALVETPEHRGPVWIAAVAAAVIAVIVVGVLLVGNPLNRPVGSAGPGHTPNASPAALPTPSPSPSPSVTCGGGSKVTPEQTPPVGFIDAIRTGVHPGYDRVTIELKNGLPTSIDMRLQDSATFTLSPSNQPVTLAGTYGMLVILKGADAHTAYNGVRDIKTNYSRIAEVRVLEDFEGQVSLGLGLKVNPCQVAVLQSAILVNPYRVVIDIPTK